MKTNCLRIIVCGLLSFNCVRAADTNPPPRLTVELRDGSRVIGESLAERMEFHSALLGDIKLDVKAIRSMEFVSTNSAKLKATNGDVLILQPLDDHFALKTGFGKVELAVGSVRKLSVAASGIVVPTHEGLIGFWAGNGNTEDSIGGDTAELVGGADYAPGLAGQAFNLETPGSYVKIPRTAALDPGSQVTVEFWMKANPDNAMNSYQGLVTSDFYGVEISNGYGGTMGVNFFVSLNPNWPARSVGWGGPVFNRITTVANFTHVSDMNGGGAPVSAGTWHIAGTYNGNQLQLYLDGQPWGRPVNRPGTIPPMLPESFVSVRSEDGRKTCPDCAGNRYFKGLISQVAIYNRALTAAEVREDYEALKQN
jgi:hypothetical protein